MFIKDYLLLMIDFKKFAKNTGTMKHASRKNLE
jgi:hypothetical protein